jgi:hypothetical protein
MSSELLASRSAADDTLKGLSFLAMTSVASEFNAALRTRCSASVSTAALAKNGRKESLMPVRSKNSALRHAGVRRVRDVDLEHGLRRGQQGLHDALGDGAPNPGHGFASGDEVKLSVVETPWKLRVFAVSVIVARRSPTATTSSGVDFVGGDFEQGLIDFDTVAGCLSHRVMVPSSTFSPRDGMRTAVPACFWVVICWVLLALGWSGDDVECGADDAVGVDAVVAVHVVE